MPCQAFKVVALQFEYCDTHTHKLQTHKQSNLAPNATLNVKNTNFDGFMFGQLRATITIHAKILNSGCQRKNMWHDRVDSAAVHAVQAGVLLVKKPAECNANIMGVL
jgi:hypothetical protein